MMKLSVFNEHCFFDILEVTGWVGARRGAVLGYPHNQKLLNFSESRSNFFLKKCIQNYRETQFSKSYCSPWMSICKKCTETYYFLLRWLDFFFCLLSYRDTTVFKIEIPYCVLNWQYISYYRWSCTSYFVGKNSFQNVITK